MKPMGRCAALAFALLFNAGCAALLVGAGAAGGYAISRDSIKNNFDLPPSQVYQVSRRIAQQEGLITLEDEKRGLIKVKVESANVTITVRRLTSKTVELKVKARNEVLLPKVEVAQAIYNEIFQQLK